MALQGGSGGETRDLVQQRRTVRAGVVIAAVLIGAVGMVLLGAAMVPERQSDIWVEIVKSSTSIVVLALAGGVVGAVLRDRDAAREDVRRREAFLAVFLDDVEAAYDNVKTARRLLRTYGFDTPTDLVVNTDQVLGLRTQMALLNEAELAFETHARKIEAMPGPFGSKGAELVRELASIHRYLDAVLHEWQTDPSVIIAGGTTIALSGWTSFHGFVGYDHDAIAAFTDGVANHVIAVEVLAGATR